MKKICLLLLCILFPQCIFGYYVCHPCCSKLELAGWWGSLDYLLWWRKERFYPPLATTNPTTAPVLSDPDTTILFGDEAVGGAPRSGIGAEAGVWLTPCVALGGSLFILGEETVDFQIDSGDAGLPIFGRPFFNVSTGVQSADTLSLPTLQINGYLDIDTSNRLWGGDLFARFNFLGSCCFQLDLLAGLFYTNIVDNLDISSQTTNVGTDETFAIADHFHCENAYLAGMVGVQAEWRSANWAIVLKGKVGLGNMDKTVMIFGDTIVDGQPFSDYGLLALPSNIGTHKDSQFEIVPEFSATLQLQVIPHVWATLGYSYVFWPAVVLSGRQVDLNINPTQVGVLDGPLAPLFQERVTSFWVQGLTAGLYIRF